MLDTINAALKEKGLTAAEASRLACGNPALIKNLQRPRGGAARPNYYAVEKLAEVLGLELYFGPPRETGSPPPAEDPELVLLPRFDVVAAAGSGAMPVGEEVVDHLAFRRDWLRRQGIRPDMAGLITLRGDSGEPYMFDGDMVLIDFQRGRLRQGSTYVFVDDDGSVRIKELRSSHDTVSLISRNPSYATEERTEADDIWIVGRAAWFGRTLP
ncbi:MAG: S24 family peptidase [Paracoccaceae bacterium]